MNPEFIAFVRELVEPLMTRIEALEAELNDTHAKLAGIEQTARTGMDAVRDGMAEMRRTVADTHNVFQLAGAEFRETEAERRHQFFVDATKVLRDVETERQGLTVDRLAFADELLRVRSLKAEPGQPGKDGAPGKDGEPGKDGAPGKDGEPGRDGAPGKDGEPGKDGAPGRDGQDGKDVDPAMVTRLSDLLDRTERAVARAEAFEPVPGPVGKDGAPGRDGQPGQPGRDGKDGAAGPPGRDGKDGREMVLKGTWSEGMTADRLNIAFQDGQGFICLRDGVTSQPGTAPDDWRLAFRLGNRGKPGEPGQTGKRGPEGRGVQSMAMVKEGGKRTLLVVYTDGTTDAFPLDDDEGGTQ
jgi:hypothetical protein